MSFNVIDASYVLLGWNKPHFSRFWNMFSMSSKFSLLMVTNRVVFFLKTDRVPIQILYGTRISIISVVASSYLPAQLNNHTLRALQLLGNDRPPRLLFHSPPGSSNKRFYKERQQWRIVLTWVKPGFWGVSLWNVNFFNVQDNTVSKSLMWWVLIIYY